MPASSGLDIGSLALTRAFGVMLAVATALYVLWQATKR